MYQLTVILISKNQAWNIARLIQSVIKETEFIASREIMLVDSASTDKTVEIASEYPIRILQLSAEQFLCPSAGRYIGYQNTTGEFVLFLDGDNELYPQWLEMAMGLLAEHDDIAGITGDCIVLPEDGTDRDKPSELEKVVHEFKAVKQTGGEALFRRSVLDEVGTFNPFLYSDEEPDLALRIRGAGYRLVKTTYPISYDYTPDDDLISTKIKRWRRNLYLGAGQNLRYRLGSGELWLYIKERGFGIVPLFGLGAGLLLFLWFLLSGQIIWFGVWVMAIVLLIAADALRKGSLYQALVSFVHRLVVADGTLRGFLMPPVEPGDYQSYHVIVK